MKLKTAAHRCLAFVGPRGEVITVTDPELAGELKKTHKPNAAGVVPLPSSKFPGLVLYCAAWFLKHPPHRPGKLYLHTN